MKKIISLLFVCIAILAVSATSVSHQQACKKAAQFALRGWGGSSNGYFKLQATNLDGLNGYPGYIFNNSAVIGIQRNTGIVPEDPNADDEWETPVIEGLVASVDFNGIDGTTLSLAMWNKNEEPCGFGFGIGELLDDGTINVVDNKYESYINFQLQKYYGWGNLPFDFSTYAEKLSNGTHKLIPISLLNGDAEWKRCHPADLWFEVNVDDGNVTIIKHPFSDLQINKFEMVSPSIPGYWQKVLVSLTNNGDNIEKTYYIFVDGVWPGWSSSVRTLKIAAGNTKEFILETGELTEGSHILTLHDGHNGPVVATQEVEIKLEVVATAFTLVEEMNFAGTTLPVDVTIENHADDFTMPLYLFASQGESIGNCVYATGTGIPSGGSEDVRFYFTPNSSGKWHLRVSTDANGNNIIGEGSVDIENDLSGTVTPDDSDGWNDLTRPHQLILNGTYESPLGLGGFIEYAVEDREDWTALTDTLASGEDFVDSLIVMFNPEKPIHEIRLRTRDFVGNTTQLPPVIYKDVSFQELTGIEEKTYTGDSLFQTNITCDLAEGQYELKTYRNNVDAGTASFNIEGVFPYTIGRKTYTFTINPQPLSGNLLLSETAFVYNGQPFTPDWQFTNANYANLEYGRDYTLSWSNNRLPGTGALTVTGKNNYTGSLTSNISIDKTQLTDNLFTLTLPNEDITYDEQSHGASITKAGGVGIATISYQKNGETETTTTQPSNAGDYTIYLEFADGSLYYGRERAQVGTFTIYEFNAEEWDILQTVLPQLAEMGWAQPWDVSQGMKGVSSLHGLTIEEGHVTGLNLSGQNLTGAFPSFLLDLPQLQSLNLANNHLNGNIGQYANSLAGLTSLNVSGNSFDEVTPMLPTTLENVNLGKQSIDRIVNLPLADLTSSYLAENVPNILFYNHAQQTYSANIRLLCTTTDGAWGMKLVSQNGQLTLAAATADNAYRGQSGDILNVALLNTNGTREGSTFSFRLNFENGDGNFDGQVNILDLQTTINYMFEEYTDKPYNFTASDLWKDDYINVQDAVSLVNLLLESEPASSRLQSRMSTSSEPSFDAEATVQIENGKLVINSLVPVSSFDITIASDQEWTMTEELSQMGFTCTVRQGNGHTRLIGYSLSGATLPAGQTVIGETGSGTVVYALLANQAAQEIKSVANAIITDIEYTPSESPTSKEVYCISLGVGRAVIIDANGKKSIKKNEKQN